MQRAHVHILSPAHTRSCHLHNPETHKNQYFRKYITQLTLEDIRCARGRQCLYNRTVRRPMFVGLKWLRPHASFHRSLLPHGHHLPQNRCDTCSHDPLLSSHAHEGHKAKVPCPGGHVGAQWMWHVGWVVCPRTWGVARVRTWGRHRTLTPLHVHAALDLLSEMARLWV